VRASRKWIRGAVVQGERVVFQNLRQLVSCEYDDFMVMVMMIHRLWMYFG